MKGGYVKHVKKRAREQQKKCCAVQEDNKIDLLPAAPALQKIYSCIFTSVNRVA
jgi:hypothetical protein